MLRHLWGFLRRLVGVRARAAAGLERFMPAPTMDFGPEPDAPLPRLWPRYWRGSGSWCSDHVGKGFPAPVCTPAPGYFWKQDRAGPTWRLYHSPVLS